jgi:hypothetical protein
VTAWRPTIAEERWLNVAAPADRTGGWRRSGLLPRCVFFMLGLAAAGLTYAFFDLVHWRTGDWLAALILVAVAEWLILSKRLFACGIEEALELSGLILLAARILHAHGHVSDVEAASLITAAVGIAGIRLLNPLLTASSIVGFSVVVMLWTPAASRSAALISHPAGGFCLAVAALALILGTVEYRRPSHDRMIAWLIVVMPAAAYVWLGGLDGDGPGSTRVLPALALAMFAVAALTVGIQRRAHPPLLAFMICMLCVAYELRRFSGLPIEARLIGGGGVVLGLAVALDRYLRTVRRGFTSRRIDETTAAAFDLLQLAGAASLAPPSATAADRFKGGDGTFGGGGASGGY